MFPATRRKIMSLLRKRKNAEIRRSSVLPHFSLVSVFFNSLAFTIEIGISAPYHTRKTRRLILLPKIAHEKKKKNYHRLKDIRVQSSEIRLVNCARNLNTRSSNDTYLQV